METSTARKLPQYMLERRSMEWNSLNPIRVAISDPHEFARIGIRALLEREDHINIVAEAQTGEELLDAVMEEKPHVALVDYGNLTRDLLSLSRTRAGRGQHGAVIVMVDGVSEGAAVQSMRAGARGCVFKNSQAWVLRTAVTAAAEGDAFLDPALLRQLFERYTFLPIHDPTSPPEELAELNERELQVTAYIGSGLSNREISRKLDMSENTVKSYVSRIMTKLGLRNRVEVALFAYRLGVISSPERESRSVRDSLRIEKPSNGDRGKNFS
ncbi:response regulator transcription factor [Streptomyces sp. YIM B13518]|uniref:response regulator transcription factor n=1 Tax=Streptomyces sp. YIM B13518 TaxID=3366316 RepID=UPI0036BAE390